MKIFWSWQADTAGNIGRHFVRDALDAAVAKLKGDLSLVEPTERDMAAAAHVDQDRQDVPGSPDLAPTILQKIASAAVFVADVTPVGVLAANLKPQNSQPSKSKLLINSNVAIELGYALHALTDRFVLFVMNDHFGTRDDLPFDLKHKAGPFIFTLAPGASKVERAKAHDLLVPRLVEALKLCLSQRAAEAAKAAASAARPVAAPAIGPALFFKRGDVLVSADTGEQHFRFEAERVAYMHIQATQLAAPVSRATIVKTFNDGRVIPFGVEFGGISFRTKQGAIVFDFMARDTITRLTHGFPGGSLWGVDGTLFHTIRPGQPDERSVLPMIEFEKAFVRTLRNYTRVETNVLGQKPPFRVVMGVEAVENAYLAVPGGRSGTGQFCGPIMEQACQFEYQLTAVDDAAIMAALKPFFERIYDLAAVTRSEVLDERFVAAHDLPPL